MTLHFSQSGSADAPRVREIRIAHDAREDRIVFLATLEDERLQPFLITRRLAGRLLNGIAALLERSSVAASKASPEVRGDVVLLEHQSAVSASPGTAEGAGVGDAGEMAAGGAERPEDALLLEAVEFKIEPKRFVLRLTAGGVLAAWFHASRGELHRLLDAMSRQAETADWNITIQAEWLSPEAEQATIN